MYSQTDQFDWYFPQPASVKVEMFVINDQEFKLIEVHTVSLTLKSIFEI